MAIESDIHPIAGSDFPVVLRQSCRMPGRARNPVSRERLISKLDESVHSNVTILHAPAGSGKTELLVQWSQKLSDEGRATAWVNLESCTTGARVPAAAIVTAIVDASATDELSRRVLEGSPRVSDCVSVLLNCLDETRGEFSLFLDGMECIQDRTAHRDIEYLIRNLPDTISIFVGTRTPIPWATSKLQMDDGVEILSFDDIKFDLQEATEFLRKNSPIPLQDGQITRLLDMSDGWPAILKLAVKELRPGLSERRVRLIVDGGGSMLADYLSENLFGPLSGEARDLLVQTAPLSRLNNDLCARIAPAIVDVPRTLDELCDRNLAIVPENERGWFRIRPVFRVFLKSNFDRLDQTDREHIHKCANTWLLENHYPAAALRHSLAIDDHQAVIHGLTVHGTQLLQDGEIELLDSCKDLLTKDQLRDQPIVSLLFIWTDVISQRYTDASEALAELRVWLRDDEAPLASFGEEEASFKDHVSVLEYRIKQAIDPDWSDVEVWERLKINQSKSSPFMLQHIELALATAQLRKGAYSEAFCTYMSVQRNAVATGSLITAVSAAVRMAQIRQKQGRLLEAEGLCTEALTTFSRLHSYVPPVCGVAYLIRAEIRYERGDLDMSRSDLNASKSLLRRYNLVVYLVAIALMEAKLAAVRGGAESALRVLAAAGSLPSVERHQRSLELVWAAQAWYMIRAGDLDTGESLLRQLAMPLGKKGPSSTFASRVRDEMKFSAMCLYLVESGNTNVASAWLTKLLHQSETAGRMVSCANFGAMLALCHLRAGDKDRALRALRTALLVAEQVGLIRTIVDLQPEVLDLVREYRVMREAVSEKSERGPGDEYLSRLAGVPGPDVAATARGKTVHDICEPGIDVSHDQFALTGRESEILMCICDGLSNRGISEELMIGEGTVKWHIKNIYSKLSVNSRTQAIAVAHGKRLVSRF